jgi:hypothetical protein
MSDVEESNLINVKEIVRRSENPHPLMLVFIIIITMLVIYCIYINSIKKSITGSWSDDAEKSHDIVHNMWKDTILVDGKHHGIVKGHLIIIYMKDQMRMGVWVNDRINWTDGKVWMCEMGY